MPAVAACPNLMLILSSLLQAHASAAIVNFSENAEPEVMGPHLDNLISKLLALLQQGQKLVQEGALTAMASVADCCQAQFVKYYDHVVPLLSAILVGAKVRAGSAVQDALVP